MKRFEFFCILLVLVLCGFSISAKALVEKILVQDDDKFCPIYAVPITLPDGWYHHKGESIKRKHNFYFPDGTDIHSAPAIMYVAAMPNVKKVPLSQYIEEYLEGWKRDNPTSVVEPVNMIAPEGEDVRFWMYHLENPDVKAQAYEVITFAADKDADGNDYIVFIVLSGYSKDRVFYYMNDYLVILKDYTPKRSS